MHVQEKLVALDGDELQTVLKLLEVPPRTPELAHELRVVVGSHPRHSVRVDVLRLVLRMVLVAHPAAVDAKEVKPEIPQHPHQPKCPSGDGDPATRAYPVPHVVVVEDLVNLVVAVFLLRPNGVEDADILSTLNGVPHVRVRLRPDVVAGVGNLWLEEPFVETTCVDDHLSTRGMFRSMQQV